MGYQLVTLSQHPYWAARLTPRARVVLGVMCRKSLDELTDGKPPALYFAGRDFLVLHECGASPGDSEYEAGVRRVERALKELRAAGAIDLLERARPGRRATYLIHVDRAIGNP